MILGDPTLAGDFLYQQKLTALSQRYSIRTEVITFEFESKATNQYFFTKVINPGEVPIDLDEQGDGFIDKKYLDKVFELNKKLSDKIDQKNDKI